MRKSNPPVDLTSSAVPAPHTVFIAGFGLSGFRAWALGSWVLVQAFGKCQDGIRAHDDLLHLDDVEQPERHWLEPLHPRLHRLLLDLPLVFLVTLLGLLHPIS